MPRLGNARTIADLEFVINAPSPGSDVTAWAANGAQCSRDIHRFVGLEYSFYFEVIRIRLDAPPKRGWNAIIIKEVWRFQGAKADARLTKSLKLIHGRASDILNWARMHRDQATVRTQRNNA